MRHQFPKLLTLLCLVSLFLLGPCFAFGDIQGAVSGSDNQPLINASIRVFTGPRELDHQFTGESGEFEFTLNEGNYTVLVSAGTSHVPASFNVRGSLVGTEVNLSPGALLEFSGDLQYVDTENLPLQTVIQVLDDQGNPVTVTGFSLIYGTLVKGPGRVSELQSNQVIVPSGQHVTVSINGTYLIGSEVNSRSVTINVNPLNQGSVLGIDFREYTIPLNQEIAESSLAQLEHLLDELNGYGFYLARQETALSTGKSLVSQSLSLYDGGDFTDSYEALKRGFLVFENTSRELNEMYRDASVSINILLAFLALSSLVLGYLITENLTTLVIVDFIIYGAALVIFYFTYPGSRIISLREFALTSLGLLSGFMVLGRFLPYFFSVGSRDGRVHTRNLVLPIFSLAKRSLRRRRLRFLLTLVSLTLLVTSFVTLTSFSQGYGVVIGEGQPRSNWKGVFIRESGWKQDEPTFLQLDEVDRVWLLSQPEVGDSYFKAENQPLQRPYSVVNGQPIYGVIGVDTSESYLVGLESILLDGNMPEIGVIVSERFLDLTGHEMGDQIYVGAYSLPIEGVFSSDALASLRDLDGSSYVSMKWVNTSPGDEAAVWVLQAVEPDEQVFTSLETAVSLPLVDVQRIGFTLQPGYYEDGFAERLALERGYRSYSSTMDGFTQYHLGNFFEGKGTSLLIPWVIVVLNVVVTMLNSLFERRKEIEILSSIGLNPAQISAVFVAEATITGFIAGGLGYLVGLGFYKVLAILNIGLQVHQKVSAIWSLASIGLAISAVLTGAFAALRSSVIITPSLMRRWKIDRTKGGFIEPWTVDIPVKLEPEEIRPYLEYMENRLNRLKDDPERVTSNVKQSPEENKLRFIYKSYHTTTGNFYTKNELLVIPVGDEYTAVLKSLGDYDWVHVVGSLVRRITMDYTNERV